MSADPIYLDYNATTPTDPRVAAAMTPYLTGHFGNPSSPHAYGRRARAAVERAREQVAALLGAEPEGVVFTSGGTEANNHAIRGAVQRAGAGGAHVVTTAVEHPAVLEVCSALADEGVRTTLVPVDGHGRVDPDAVDAACTDDTVLVSVMHANNEVGTLQPVAEIAAQAHRRGILVHSDCAQSVGKVPVTMAGLGVDMLSLAGHKLYAPKGVGVLCLRPGLVLPNLMHGAGHEGGRRPGTENVLEIVGLGAACELAGEDLDGEGRRLTALRDTLAAELIAAVPTARVHGHPELRLPNTLSIGFPGHVAAELLAALPEIAVSAGAACHGDGEIGSHVLAAMGVPLEHARGTLRISLGRMTTPAKVTAAGAALRRVLGSA
jgi:cysteine desulfurase